MFQIVQAQALAAQNNITVGDDMQSLLSLVNPLHVIQELLMSYPAKIALPNIPEGKVSDVCYNDVTASLDSFVAFKKWAIDS